MTITLRKALGSDKTLDRDALTIVRKFEVIGLLPFTGGGDAFDSISSQVMATVVSDYPTYPTDMGTLFWNSIQIHESHYAQKYEISVTYSPLNKQTGTYQITLDQAVGNVHVVAGRRIAGYDGTGTCPDNGGTFFDGQKVTGTDIPVAEDSLSISYRHPQGMLNAAYLRATGRLRGYPNADTFLGYEPGEIMYLGGPKTQTDCEASAVYNFAVSYNETNFDVAGVTIAEKKGFDVISPTWEPDVDGNDNAVRNVLGIEIIRPREWKNYKAVFGWG